MCVVNSGSMFTNSSFLLFFLFSRGAARGCVSTFGKTVQHHVIYFLFPKGEPEKNGRDVQSIKEKERKTVVGDFICFALKSACNRQPEKSKDFRRVNKSILVDFLLSRSVEHFPLLNKGNNLRLVGSRRRRRHCETCESSRQMMQRVVR